ncbi:MAG: hypothetical protein KKG64_02790 [Firmicutes bacterium]|nr:hypothetical protein [Bacillota bacterium]
MIKRDSLYPTIKFIHRSKLKALNISNYIIKQYVEQGYFNKINNNYYENLNYQGDENDFYYVFPYIPQGVVCLMSAAVYHGLSEYRSFQIDVAVERQMGQFKIPDWPAMGIYYFGKKRYEIGILEIDESGNQYKIYDKEKTVCDLLLYRNKFGLEDALSVLKNYLKKPDRDLNKLVDYAQKLNVFNTLSKYMEVLV